MRKPAHRDVPTRPPGRSLNSSICAEGGAVTPTRHRGSNSGHGQYKSPASRSCTWSLETRRNQPPQSTHQYQPSRGQCLGLPARAKSALPWRITPNQPTDVVTPCETAVLAYGGNRPGPRLYMSGSRVTLLAINAIKGVTMASDPVKVDSKHYQVEFENDRGSVLKPALCLCGGCFR